MFNEGAHWKGTLIKDMTKEQLIEALFQKVTELRWCYNIMPLDQQKIIADKLKEAGWI